MKIANDDPVRLRLRYITPKLANFQADVGGSDYGTEFDIKLKRKFWEIYTILTSYSSYNADEFNIDTKKFWLQLTVEY